MHRPLTILFLGLAAILTSARPSLAQSLDDPASGRGGTVTFTLDGRTHTSGVRAYMVDGLLFLNGIWVEDSTVRFGRAGLASTFLLRVDGRIGSHPVAPAAKGDAGALLSVLYGGSIPGRMYEILRSDRNAGEGSVTVNTLTDRNAAGTFQFTAHDTDDPARKKNIEGRFDVEFRKIGVEERE